ncbi:MAG: DUF5050 domain-containing protein [Bifidobacteriaceae bacterium]|jgi:hypothetical protein|nr:DUF5050 domain-containing protein [Bifidobacteriaceae bacterium]
MSDREAFLGAYRDALSQEAATWPPELLAMYRAESCLKDSGDRQVFLVTDLRTGGRAILRVSQIDQEDTPDPEYSILNRLDHLGIPKAYGTLTRDGRRYMAREFIEGQSLDQVLASGPMSTGQILDVCRQLTELLRYLHSLNPPVIHRDIKPHNIILRPDGKLGLTDFGIARTFKAGSDSDTQHIGTLPYAAPEQYGYAQSSPLTDIYGLGILLIHLATGSPDRRDLNHRIKDRRLLRLIERCIAFDPSDRFQSAAELSSKIASAKRRPHPVLAGLVAGIVGAALVAGGVWWAVEHFGDKSAGGATTPTESANQSPGTAPTAGPSVEPPAGQASMGNLTGNIQNGGFAVEGAGGVFLATEKAVYHLTASGEVITEIENSGAAHSLSFWNGLLYWGSYNSGLNSYDPVTGHRQTLLADPVGKVHLDNGIIYYQDALDGLKLYRLDPADQSRTKVHSANTYYGVVFNGYYYYAEQSDGEKLFRTDLSTGDTAMLYDDRSAWPSPFGQRLYFSDFTVPGGLMMAGLDGGFPTQLSAGSASQIVAHAGGLVYYNHQGKLVASRFDGGWITELTSNSTSGHCVAADWVFYENSTDGDIWMVRLDGTDDHRFEPNP